MTYDPEELKQQATAMGFRSESFEKASRLLSLLEAVKSHPFLRSRMALKGGTALNLFLFDVPRLSVDIDLNYVGTPDRDAMLKERPKVEEAIQAVCSRERLTVRRAPSEHAGGKWRLSYANAAGRPGNLELDVNFMLRVPLWPIALFDSRAMGTITVKQIPIVDRHELAAGKLAALCARQASRDLFDACGLLQQKELSLDTAKLRLAFVIYGGINRKDWRSVHIEDIEADPAEVERELVPMLRSEIAPTKRTLKIWTAELVKTCRERMSLVLPLAKHEYEFIERLNTRGEIAPELLTSDHPMQDLIRDHPGLKWKALNARKNRESDSPNT